MKIWLMSCSLRKSLKPTHRGKARLAVLRLLGATICQAQIARKTLAVQGCRIQEVFPRSRKPRLVSMTLMQKRWSNLASFHWKTMTNLDSSMKIRSQSKKTTTKRKRTMLKTPLTKITSVRLGSLQGSSAGKTSTLWSKAHCNRVTKQTQLRCCKDKT